MFFCPNCNNLYAKIVPGAQAGGAKDTDISPSTVSTLSGGQNMNTSDIIKQILNEQPLTVNDLGDLDLEKLTKSSEYKKLQNKQKELVYNTIAGLLPANMPQDNVTTGESQKASFVCTNCGTIEPIKQGTLIIRRVADTNHSEQDDLTKYKDFVNMKDLPITRRYICPNGDCPSHSKPELREAVFLRADNSFKVIYVCKECKTVWT